MTTQSIAKERSRKTAPAGGGKIELARLPEPLAEGLRFFWHEYPATIGLKSTMGDQIARLQGISFGGRMKKCQTLSENLVDGRSSDRMVGDGSEGGQSVSFVRVSHNPAIHDPFERLVQPGTILAIRRARGVHQRLSRMIDQGDSLLVTVLHRVYGPRPPGELHPEIFGEEAAPIVEYTDIVEAERRSMAIALAEERCLRWGVPFKAPISPGDLGDAGITEKTHVIERALRLAARSGTFREIMCGSRPSRRASVFAQAEREVTRADVIRAGVARLNVVRAKDEPKVAFDERLNASRADVDRWATRIKHQALELLIRASNAYRAAGASVAA